MKEKLFVIKVFPLSLHCNIPLCWTVPKILSLFEIRDKNILLLNHDRFLAWGSTGLYNIIFHLDENNYNLTIQHQFQDCKIFWHARMFSHFWYFCDPLHCPLPDSSVRGIFQSGILEWVSISISWGSSWPRDWTCVSCIGRQILYHGATREAPRVHMQQLRLSTTK